MKSVRKKLIRILSGVAATREFPIQFGENSTLDEIRLVSDLIDNDYLDGGHVENESGVPCNAVITGITLSGREYVDQLEAEEFEKSSKGRLLRILKYLGVFALGVVGTLLTQWLMKKLGLN